ncbi:GNAT family N-acetyltransferase [Actinomadura sp. GTD37]|uniref:GNAT family N-acetyltransferase n=1 Tax=Actinomadura sp. GTD37 TaxID=1778030 RepID=UPI0035C0803F
MDTDTGARQRSRAAHPSYRIRPARPDELDVVLGLIDHAAAWLRAEKATTQWAAPWPSPDGRLKRVNEALITGETWLLFDAERPIGTVSIKTMGQEELWTAQERETEAVYLHRLVIHRDYKGKGLGAELIDWAGRAGAACQERAELIRIDVWTDNTALHAYYLGLGFEKVATRETSDRTPSGALFQRPLDLVRTAGTRRIVEAAPHA